MINLWITPEVCQVSWTTPTLISADRPVGQLIAHLVELSADRGWLRACSGTYSSRYPDATGGLTPRGLPAGDSVGAASRQVGFASTSAYVAAFRREIGTSPARYFR